MSFEDPLRCVPQAIQKSSLILLDSRDNTVDASLKHYKKHIRHILYVHHQELAQPLSRIHLTRFQFMFKFMSFRILGVNLSLISLKLTPAVHQHDHRLLEEIEGKSLFLYVYSFQKISDWCCTNNGNDYKTIHRYRIVSLHT